MPVTAVCKYCSKKTLIGDLKAKHDKHYICGHCGKKNGRGADWQFPIMRQGGDPSKLTQGGIPWMGSQNMRVRHLP